MLWNKLLYLQIVMGKYLKIIGLLALALVLWQTSSAAFTVTPVSVGESVDIQAVAVSHHQDETCFTSPQLPYLPVAELASSRSHMQLLTMSRIQRSYISEYIFSLKDWVDKLAQREAVLSLNREKLFDATAYYRCQPVCEYYIFTLRRILI